MQVTACERADATLPQHNSESGATCAVVAKLAPGHTVARRPQPLQVTVCAWADQPAYTSAALCHCRAMPNPCYPGRSKEVSPTYPGLVSNSFPLGMEFPAGPGNYVTAVAAADLLS